MLSGRGLCDGLITRPEESYRLWCVVVRSRNLMNEEAVARIGPQRLKKEKNYDCYLLRKLLPCRYVIVKCVYEHTV